MSDARKPFPFRDFEPKWQARWEAETLFEAGKDLPPNQLKEFEARFLGALKRRTVDQRTTRYEDVREIMEAARPQILEKARTMGRSERD